MDKLIQQTRRKFVAVIIAVVAIVVFGSWAILQTYNQREIASPADISEVTALSQHNEAFGEYLEEQKDFEAHFIALASSIKEQEANRVTSALAVTAVTMGLAGALIAYVVARKLTKPVEEAYQSQERFIQDAAHELRNPLAAMTVALQQAEKAGKRSQLTTTFRRQTKRLIHINEDLLFLERRNKQSPSDLNISELLSDIVEELQPLAAKKQITIKLSSDPGIMKTMAASDYVRLAKNIIDNAIKYSKPASTVTVTQRKTKSGIHLQVVDRGIGIPKKDQSDIGSRFFRASNTGDIMGTGLGLAIVQKILNVYGGTIDITSTTNKGTTVDISL